MFLESRLIDLFSTLSLKILSYLKLQFKENIFSIRNINITIFYLLVKRSQLDEVQIFTLFIKNINTLLVFICNFEVEAISLFVLEFIIYSLKEVKIKLSSKYYKFLDVFNRFQANKFSLYRSYNYKIRLIDDFISL